MKWMRVFPLLVLLVLKSPAQILIYDCTSRITSASDGTAIKRIDTGRVFYDWTTTNYINVMVDKPSKSFSVVTSSNSVAVTIQGSGQDAFTVFPAVVMPALPAGSTFVGPVSFPGIGQNQTLTIGSSNTFVFPRTFTYQSQNVSYGGDSSSFTVSTTTSTFSTTATRSANQQGQSMNDAANAMVNSLQTAGYNQSN